MIIHVFRARVQPGKRDDFERMVVDVSTPLVEAQKGLVARYSGRPTGSNTDEFVMVSVWKDLESLRAFAGQDWGKAVIPEEEHPVLRETFVHHYESIGPSHA